MNNPHTLSDQVEEPVFIFQVVVTVALVTWPFLAILLGSTFGILVVFGAVYAADRYLAAARKKEAEEIQTVAIPYQRYVAQCAKRFFWARMIPVVIIAYFLNQPAGLIYFLFCGAISIAEVIWESSKLGDMESKEPIQPPQTTTGSSAPDRA